MSKTHSLNSMTAIHFGVSAVLVSMCGTLHAQQPPTIAPSRVFDIQTVWAGVAPAGKVIKVVGNRSLYFLVSPTFSTL